MDGGLHNGVAMSDTAVLLRAGNVDDATCADALFHSATLPMWVYDLVTLRFLAVNAAALAFFRTTRAAFLALDMVAIRPPEAIPSLLDFVTDEAAAYLWLGMHKYRRSDGTDADLEVTSYPVLWEGRTARCVVGMELAAWREAAGHGRYTSLYDGITGLPSRTLFVDRLEHATRRVLRDPQKPLAVLFVDLDRFHHVNDSFGYAAGDAIIVAVARRLRETMPLGYGVARIGGDQFAVLIEDERTPDVTEIAAQLLRTLAAPHCIEGHEIIITASIGIAVTESADTAEGYLRNAAIALRRAKDRGKGRSERFDRGMHEEVRHTLRMETELRRALEREEFRLHYQPIVALESGTLVGLEALVRWQHPERGLVPPAEFIPVAEEAGLQGELAVWIRREACHQMQVWRQRLPSLADVVVSVNISGSSFGDPQFVPMIAEVLAETGLPPANLKMEITESVMMQNADAISTLHRVRDLGVRIGMDDFGTGYSSLSYLHRLPVDTLKIDRSFIWSMGKTGENVEIVRAIVRLGQTLGLEIVAEGIETGEQRALLAEMGCDLGQGYLFARPAAPEAIERVFTRAVELRLAPSLLHSPPAA